MTNMHATQKIGPVTGLVSTIIPVYNRPDMLRQAVQSVLAQTYRPIEIIIADDGSTDDAGRVADELAGKHPREIRVVHNPNQGPGPARESGRQMARGEYIQYLDSDDLLAPRKFEIQVAALQRRLDCGVAYGITRLVDTEGRVLKEPFKWTGKQIEHLFPGLLVDRWWCTHTPLYRRSLCDCIGPWSDLRYSQDWEYDGRVGALGTKLAFCPEHVSDHRTHSGVRQTGSGRWLDPMDRARFFASLLKSAQSANVGVGAPERRHFARWVFRHARECGALGDAPAARACLTLAVEARGTPSRDMRLYRALAIICGWRLPGYLAALFDRRFRRRAGSETQRLSWMQP